MIFSLVKDLIFLLSTNQKRQLLSIQIFFIIATFLEIIGILSIIPFVTLVSNINLIYEKSYLSDLFFYFNFSSEIFFLVCLGILILLSLIISSLFSIFTFWRIFMFGNQLGIEIEDRLFNYYMEQGWISYILKNSSTYTKKISVEAQRVTSGIIIPLLQMNAKILFVFFIVISIAIYNPLIAFIGASLFTFSYMTLYKSIKNFVFNNGQKVSEMYDKRFSIMNNAFGGKKEILLLGKIKQSIIQFEEAGKKISFSQGTNHTLVHVPRYFFELITFGSIIAFIIYLINFEGGNLQKIIPTLSIFVIAGYKLLPSIQQVFAYITTIRGNLAAFNDIKDDLKNSLNLKVDRKNLTKEKLSIKKEIKFLNINFSYPSRTSFYINNLNLKIEAKSSVGIIGPTGSGKSTIIDILTGLIKPNSGCLKVDDTEINYLNLRKWQNNLSYVSQNIFLTDGSIMENIALGANRENINIDKIKESIKLASLDSFIESLQDNIHTKVGERGIQLSGGQKQRIGIARSLYNESDILIFDEATSALDVNTERKIIDSIYNLKGQKTIIFIAHRLTTVKHCDRIYLIDKGSVRAQGKYDDLVIKNNYFKV